MSECRAVHRGVTRWLEPLPLCPHRLKSPHPTSIYPTAFGSLCLIAAMKKKKKGTSFACCFFSVAKWPICIINTCIDLLWHHNHYICYAKIVLWQSKTVFKVNGCLPLPRVFLLFPQSGRNYGWFQNTWSHDSKSVFVKIQGWVSLPTGSTFPTLPYFPEDEAEAGSERERESPLYQNI